MSLSVEKIDMWLTPDEATTLKINPLLRNVAKWSDTL